MKKQAIQLLALTLMGSLLLVGCRTRQVAVAPPHPAATLSPTGQIVVIEQPPPSRDEAIGAPPSASHVWMPGHWMRADAQWVWVPGHWETRPRPGAIWVPGQWNRTAHGWVWVPGRWN
jgi:uncharacterized lipoprotein NlpE involved in copper resistance